MKPVSTHQDEALLIAAADALLSYPFPAGAGAVLAERIRALYDLAAVGLAWLESGPGDRLFLAVADREDEGQWRAECVAVLAQTSSDDRERSAERLHVQPLPDDAEPAVWLISTAPLPAGRETLDQIGQWCRNRMQIERQATRDSLTGLLNRSLAEEWASALLCAAQRHQRTVVAMMMDLDDFKLINDHHGHLVGDRYLQAVADVLRTHVRGSDEVFRMGGDEFLILLPETSLHDATRVAQRLQTLIHELRVPGERGEARSSISVGVAASDGSHTWDELRSKADQALYAAKPSGTRP